MKGKRSADFIKIKQVQYVFFGVILTISFLVLGRLLLQNISEVQAAFRKANFWYLIFTLPIFVLSSVLTSVVWGQMMRAVGLNLPLSAHIRIYLATLFAGRLPGGIWNVVGRMAWYNLLGIPKKVTLVVSGLQWFMILLSGCIFIILTLPWLVINSINNYVIFFGAILIIVMLLNPIVINYLLRIALRNPDLPKIYYKQLIVWLTQYLFIWSLGGGILFFVVSAFYPIKVLEIPIVLSAWGIGAVSGSFVTFLPSGLGITELSTTWVLSQHIPPAIAVIATLCLRVLLTFYEFLLSGITYFLNRRPKDIVEIN